MTRVEVLAIGDELLDGRVTDTNSVRLAQALGTVGLHLMQTTHITDDIAIIVREAQAVAARGTQLCVVSGGLGPTTDDLTAAALAQLCGVALVRDVEQEARLRAYLARRNRPMTENQLKQADRPQGAALIPNPVGSAPGFVVEHQGCRFVSVPGIPREFDALVEAAVVAPLRTTSKPVLRRGLYCFGIIEADVDKRLSDLTTRWPTVRLQYRVKFPETHVTMHADNAAEADLDAAAAYATEKLDAHVFAHEDVPFAQVVLQLLQARGLTLAVAESCTGGLVSDMLTDIPGSGNAFLMGVATYANDSKQTLLNVRAEDIVQHGAVSEQVVTQMAQGVRDRAQSHYGIAISGIAGPTGGTPEKPVGTVWLAVSGPTSTRMHCLHLPFDRRQNKVVSAYSALDMLRRELLRA